MEPGLVDFIKAWLETKHCTLFLNWTISSDQGRQECAEYLAGMIIELDTFILEKRGNLIP